MPSNNVQPPTQSKQTKQPMAKPGSENEGEGSRTAARNYDNATEAYVKSGRVDEAAKKAAEALEGPEAEELRKAEADAAEDARVTLPGAVAGTAPAKNQDLVSTSKEGH